MTDSREPARPEPDALLAAAAREGRGRLKVYLGMAPGVGKTFAMLEGARRMKAQGADVVVGVVETHGRKETEALVEDFETIPRKQIVYRGHMLSEFDLDAALARRPKLLLVDEYAHTNAPDSRHPKRWQDIDELLKAGIDVDTALNIQHLEGLNDVVARITGVQVRETIPDEVLRRADEIELIDLTPEELTQRLQDGKVYAGELAGRALESFFKPGNLSALRELALRRTAERVDDQMVGYMRAHAIEGPWATSERLMACVGPDGSGAAVVRATHRLAEQLKAPWIAVTIETPEQALHASPSVAEALSLALSLGGRTERVVESNLPDAILRYARKNNVTQIVIGRSRNGWIREVLRRSLAHELVRRSEGVSISVITGAPRRPRAAAPQPRTFPKLDLDTIFTVLASTTAVVALGWSIPVLRDPSNISILFLAAVIIAALRHGLIASLATAILSFMAYNFFFTDPLFTLAVEDARDIFALVLFTIVATVTGMLASRVRDQVRAAQSRMAALQILFDFAKRLGRTTTATDLAHAIVLQAHRLADRPAMLLLPENGDLAIRYAWPPDDTLNTAAWAAARYAYINGEPAGFGTNTLPSAAWHFRPLKTARGIGGVLGLMPAAKGIDHELAQTLDALLDQTAVALERIALGTEAARVESLAETERLRSALLSSISHDLRTPLTSVLGSVTALRATPTAFDVAARDELLATIQEEAERLDRFVRNLLDMTRVESGALDFKREWFAPGDIVDATIRRFAKQTGDKHLASIVNPDLPLLHADFVLLETTLFNLVDNAIKHAEGAGTITLAAFMRDNRICLEVRDDGPGIPPEYLGQLFDKFFRVQRGDKAAAGTGLGLAICKGLVEAMGGEIGVTSPYTQGRGAAFTVSFPVEPQPARAVELETQT